MSYDKAREIMSAGRAQHFDPDVVDAFLSGFDAFVAIARQHVDEAEALLAARELPLPMA
jgi:putative two-component system response regulator